MTIIFSVILCAPWGKGSFVHPYESKIEILMRFNFDSEARRRLGYRLIDQIDGNTAPFARLRLPRKIAPRHEPLGFRVSNNALGLVHTSA
jgi:hypothetical protein